MSQNSEPLVSLLRWRSGGVEHPHDTPPYPFMPSPTFTHSSIRAELPPSTVIEASFQVEIRVGQKNKLTDRWPGKADGIERDVACVSWAETLGIDR